MMLLAFDGHCVMCNFFVRLLLRHDRYKRLTFTSSNTPAGAAIFDAQGQNPAMPVSVILINGARTHLESDAILTAIAQLGGIWSLVGIARILPRVIRDAAYRLVGRNRYRWFGRYDSCPLPDPAHAGRFVQ